MIEKNIITLDIYLYYKKNFLKKNKNKNKKNLPTAGLVEYVML